ncbi:MAG: hypothetical protein JWM19_4849 [Actinomycetia bacterium]|nr:hypothetical protein [Actinomycetes bacterium]
MNHRRAGIRPFTVRVFVRGGLSATAPWAASA